jgi:hypothetical protein
VLVHGGDNVLAGRGHGGRGSGGSGWRRWPGGFMDCEIELTEIEFYFGDNAGLFFCDGYWIVFAETAVISLLLHLFLFFP